MLPTIPNEAKGKRRARFRSFMAISLVATLILGAKPRNSHDHDLADPIVGIAQLPASVDAVVVIEQAASLRAFDSGGAVVCSLMDAGMLTKTTTAWEDLSSSLGWTPGEAFDELFGRRVVLAFDELQNPSGPRWVVVADVNELSEARIRKKLELAPRTVANGTRVLAGERGRFRLAVIPGLPDSGVSSLLIAPVDHKAFFFQTLEALTNPEAKSARFGDTPGYHQLKALERRSLRVVVQPSSDAGESETFFALSAKCNGTDWIADWSGSLSLLGISPEVARGSHAWPQKAFGAVSEDSLLAVMGVTARIQIDTLGSLGRFATGLLNLGGAASAFSDTGPVQMFAISRTATTRAQDNETTPQIELIVAAQTTQPGNPAAIDKSLAKFIASVSESTPQSDLDLFGAFPHAVRTVKIDVGSQSTFAWLHNQGEDMTISWCQTDPPIQSPDEASHDAWWIVQMSGSRAKASMTRLTAIAQALASDTSTPTSAKRISMGVVSPRDLMDWLSDLGMNASGELAILRDFETFRWDAWIKEGRLIEGQARLTVRPQQESGR